MCAQTNMCKHECDYNNAREIYKKKVGEKRFIFFYTRTIAMKYLDLYENVLLNKTSRVKQERETDLHTYTHIYTKIYDRIHNHEKSYGIHFPLSFFLQENGLYTNIV